MREYEPVEARFDGLTITEINNGAWWSDNSDPSFMRGYVWALIPSLAVWALLIFLAFSVFG